MARRDVTDRLRKLCFCVSWTLIISVTGLTPAGVSDRKIWVFQGGR